LQWRRASASGGYFTHRTNCPVAATLALSDTPASSEFISPGPPLADDRRGAPEKNHRLAGAFVANQPGCARKESAPGGPRALEQSSCRMPDEQ